jgi:hypothetical protein
MDFTLNIDEAGRFVCTLDHQGAVATVTASNVPAAGDELEGALEDARTEGYGECFWQEQGGEYHWLFRRNDDRITVVVLWSSGTLTGWQHVFRADGKADAFEEAVRSELDRARRPR